MERPEQGVLLLQLRGIPLAGRQHREPDAPAPARGAGVVPVHHRGRPDPGGQRPWAGRFEFDHRSDDCPAARRHSELHCRQHGGRQPRSAHAAAHVFVQHGQRDQVPDRACGRQCDRQAPAVLVDDIHGSGLDAGYHEQSRAQLPRLPQHGQSGLRSLHHARHRQIDARVKSCQRVHRRRLGRCDDVRARDQRRPVLGDVRRRTGRVPPEHQRRRRDHERGVDRLVLRRAKPRPRSSRTRSAGCADRTASRPAARGPAPTYGCRISSTCRP